MKLLKTILFLALLFIFGACNDGEREAAEVEEVVMEDSWDADEAMTEWRDNWNANDSTSLRAATANDAVLFMEGRALRNDSVTAWINNSASWMNELATTPVVKNKGENFAFEAGTYTHSTRENDTLQLQGTYTVIWERMDEDWKIKLIDVSPVTNSPPMPMEE
ncbi:DUF4440 domain-containing protein [Salinimicrobium sp. CAU 1759]